MTTVGALHIGGQAKCPHGGMVMLLSAGDPRARTSQQAICTADKRPTVVGCAFAIGPKPQPCVTVQWLKPALRVRVNRQPAINHSSIGLCLSAENIPNGPVVITGSPERARVQ